MQGKRWLLGCLGLLFSCGAPDRAYVEGTRGWGAIDPNEKLGSYDTEGYALTVGVEVPLGARQERVEREPCPFPHWAPAPPTAQPVTSGSDVPWEEILFLAGGVVSAVGVQYGHRSYKTFRSRRKTT